MDELQDFLVSKEQENFLNVNIGHYNKNSPKRSGTNQNYQKYGIPSFDSEPIFMSEERRGNISSNASNMAGIYGPTSPLSVIQRTSQFDKGKIPTYTAEGGKHEVLRKNIAKIVDQERAVNSAIVSSRKNERFMPTNVRIGKQMSLNTNIKNPPVELHTTETIQESASKILSPNRNSKFPRDIFAPPKRNFNN